MQEEEVLSLKVRHSQCSHSLSAGGRGSLTQGKTLSVQSFTQCRRKRFSHSRSDTPSAVIHPVQEEEVLSLKVRHSQCSHSLSAGGRGSLTQCKTLSVQSFTQCRRKRFSHSRSDTLSAVIHPVQEEEVLSLKVRHSQCSHSLSAGGRGSLTIGKTLSVQSFTQCRRKRFSHSRSDTLSAVIHSVQEEEVLSLNVRHSRCSHSLSAGGRGSLTQGQTLSVQSFTQCRRKRFSHSR